MTSALTLLRAKQVGFLVDENGYVEGVEAGTAVITASIEVDDVTYSDSCTVTVTA